MSYLLYCIFRNTPQPGSRVFPEFRGQPVFVVSQDGLSAGLSELAAPGLIAGIPDLVAYEDVIEFFYREHTVLPLQFGCQVGGISEALDRLAARQSEYVSLLALLEGMGEMGIHVLFEEADSTAGEPMGSGLTDARLSSASSGAAYLAARREIFLNRDQQAIRQRRLADSLCDSLSRFFVRRKIKMADSAGSPLLSLYFLVRNERIDDFRRAACRFQAAQPVKLLQSGPWPPFNFVDFPGRE
jgi:gas vesicle protein GvpL/GvpF